MTVIKKETNKQTYTHVYTFESCNCEVTEFYTEQALATTSTELIFHYTAFQ